MSTSPKVSIILPSLNVGAYIRECMESVVNQTLKEVEIICVDAGSTDGTLETLQEYAERDPRIRLLSSGKRSYGYQVNMGLDTAMGEYIGIVETDDYIDRNMYLKLYETAEETQKPDIVKAAYYQVDTIENGGITPHFLTDTASQEVFTISDHPELLCGHPSIWSCLYKKSFLERRNIRMMECSGAAWVDNPFLFRTLCEAERIVWLHEPLYYYRRTNPDASSNLKNCSIPIDRINDVKDYLDQQFKGNLLLEKCLFLRTLNNFEELRDNPCLTEENKKQMRKTLRRFRPRLIFLTLTARKYRAVRDKMNMTVQEKLWRRKDR